MCRDNSLLQCEGYAVAACLKGGLELWSVRPAACKAASLQPVSALQAAHLLQTFATSASATEVHPAFDISRLTNSCKVTAKRTPGAQQAATSSEHCWVMADCPLTEQPKKPLRSQILLRICQLTSLLHLQSPSKSAGPQLRCIICHMYHMSGLGRPCKTAHAEAHSIAHPAA